MYQILKRGMMDNHAHSDFYQTDYFFLNEENAIDKVKQLSSEYLGITFHEVVDFDDEGNQILDFVHYDIANCYKVVKIVPFEEKDKLPF
jgi:histidinol phosphatase-like PHP family hydrolase